MTANPEQLTTQKLSPIEQAQQMGEWLEDFIFAETDEIGPLPEAMVGRIESIFGEGTDHTNAMKIIRREVSAFSDNADDEHNFMLFMSGYPLDAIATLGMGNTDGSLNRFYDHFATIAHDLNPSMDKAQEAADEIIAKPEQTNQQKTRAKKVGDKTIASANFIPVKRKAPMPIAEFAARDFIPLSEKTLVPMNGIPCASPVEGMWQDKALCAQTDPEVFFPEKGGSTREAKKICLGCEVRNECLEHALQKDERFGIWGGLSERERRRLKKGGGIIGEVAHIDTNEQADIKQQYELLILPDIKVNERGAQLFRMVYRGEPDESVAELVDYDDEAREVFVNIIVGHLYHHNTAQSDPKVEQRLKRYFSATETTTQEEAEWFHHNQVDLERDLRHFDRTMRRAHEQAAELAAASGEAGMSFADLCRSYFESSYAQRQSAS